MTFSIGCKKLILCSNTFYVLQFMLSGGRVPHQCKKFTHGANLGHVAENSQFTLMLVGTHTAH